MARSVAINVAANTNEPGFRGPIRPDGGFEYVPIPESEPTREPVPTYGDLPVEVDIPAELADTPVHLDPTFAGYGPCDRYTYGDEHGVKARPLRSLSAGDHVFFYATLTPTGDPGERAAWIAPRWGAYVIGRFELARDPVSGDEYRTLGEAERAPWAANAHVRRATFDAEVLLLGDPERSRLYDRAVPLSAAGDPTAANPLVTEASADSGRGPWWRRPLRFDPDGTERLLALEGSDDAAKTELASADAPTGN